MAFSALEVSEACVLCRAGTTTSHRDANQTLRAAPSASDDGFRTAGQDRWCRIPRCSASRARGGPSNVGPSVKRSVLRCVTGFRLAKLTLRVMLSHEASWTELTSSGMV
eukprot:772409-Rhodomonas_salina.4